VARQGPADAGELDRQEPRPAVPLCATGRRRDRGLHHSSRHHLRASFLAISPGHPIAEALAAERPDAAEFIARCKQGGTTAAEIETAEKLGFDTGLTVTHPLDPSWQLPVWIANFVLMDYGTGALFGVPGHDARDYDFATKYGLPIKRVVAPSLEQADAPLTDAETIAGVAVNSRFLDGLTTEEAKAKVIAQAEAEGWARARPNIACATGASAGSVTGGHPSPSSIAKAAAPFPCRATSFLSSCRRTSLRRARQPARPPSDVEQGRLPQVRQAGPARNGHARYVRQLVLVLHPLCLAARGQAVRRCGG
jgi:hypothetical protein